MLRVLVRIRSETTDIVVKVRICLVPHPPVLPVGQLDCGRPWHWATLCLRGMKGVEGFSCFALQYDGILSPIYVS